MTKYTEFQQRVLDESVELGVKLNALSIFISENPIFDTLPEDEQYRLKRQLDAMSEYDNILHQRIDAFGSP